MASTYTAKDITVLEGLEPVRKRPGMYIGGVGSAGLHHLVWEIVDNAVDEAMNGHATEIMVYKLWNDGFIGLKLGSSAAQSVILMIVVVGLTMLQFRYAEKKVTY